MSTVKDLKITYNPANNETNTFTVGDTVTGQVELELHKQCEPQSLSIKFKGKAEVLWTERHGKTTVVYHAKNKYFSIKHHFIKDKDKTDSDGDRILSGDIGKTYSNVLPPGRHIYPFTFKFPLERTPSSFHADTGKIVYLLEAKLSRSMRIPKKDTTKLNYVTQDVMDHNPELKEPQHETKDKKLKLFNSGTVSMDVDLEKLGFYQGESIKVLADIQNNSTRDIKPKFCVYSKHSFFANGKRRLHTKDLVKEVGAPIPPSSRQKVTQLINIPPDMEPSIHNCDIIKVEHRLRVYLDVKYASDPEIKFPIVILNAHHFAANGPPPAASGFGFGAYGNANFPLYNQMPYAPQPGPYSPPGAMLQPSAPPPNPSDLPPPYTAYGMYPSLSQYDTKP
ncbi:arrestin domain-containing protein 3-like [Periophthalmus magnuspinnatus]|uniref:arrestin domain-containing protein 3-like n=1 Tax=Periophthalmus magnuspinnatus TaxID=409849 RepID=UPI00145A4388|nr:arrestin domain-containing protein 3-like [Periophthalmus magnuspinnatus]